MLRKGRILVGCPISSVLHDSHVVVVDRHNPIIKDQFHLRSRFFFVQVVRYAVVMQVFAQLYVIVELDAHPLGRLHGKPFGRQHVECRAFGALKEFSTADRHPLQVLVVVLLQQLPDCLIQFFKTVECPVSHRCVDPLICKSYRILDQSFVAGFTDSGRNNHRRIVFAKLCIVGIDVRFVAVGSRYRRAKIVRDDCTAGTAKIVKRPFIRSYPVFLFLAFRCLHIGKPASAEYRHERFYLNLFTGFFVDIAQLVPGIIDKHFVSGFVLDVHTHVTAASPHLEVVAELRILKSFGVLSLVFLP